MIKYASITLALIAPTLALAVGLDDDIPPKPTPTTTECLDGQVYDPKTGVCVDKSSALIDDDTRFQAVRELAYAGQYKRAEAVLDAMNAADSRVLTYRGFIARKTGKTLQSNAYYRAALDADPDNLLARSYMGQGMVAAGDRAGARVQLAEIRARGGRNSWAETALRQALLRGAGFSY